MKNSELRKVPFKNYVILGVVIVVTIFILNYFYMWVDVYKESKINIPIMDKYMTVINYNELEDYLVENPNTIVYVSVLENDTIREFEKKLKIKYKNKQVENELLYMNITDDIDKSNISNEMNNKYSLNNLSMTNVPVVLVFKDGLLKSIYSISENNYDVDRAMIYINNIKLESDGV